MKKNKKLTQDEIASFCGQLSLLLPAGITPYEAIILMREDSSDRQGKAILEQLETALKDGLSFHEALKNADVFPDYVVSMVLLGEESGNLDIVMKKLSEYYEQQCSLSSSIKNAISYPIVMICLMLIILAVLLAKILPIFNQVFLQLGSELTGVAAKLMNIGNSIESLSGALIIVAVFIGILFFTIYHIPICRQKWMSFLHTNKLTRNFYLGISYARFASAMSMVTASGVDLFHGLNLAEMLVDNEIVSQQIKMCSDSISKGDYLYEAMKNAGMFQSKHLRMLQIGQRSGETDVVLSKIANYYEEETLTKMHRILGAIEPTIVIFFSLMVGMILLSVIMPLIGIMSSIG